MPERVSASRQALDRCGHSACRAGLGWHGVSGARDEPRYVPLTQAVAADSTGGLCVVDETSHLPSSEGTRSLYAACRRDRCHCSHTL